jgi:hypothetical protein
MEQQAADANRALGQRISPQQALTTTGTAAGPPRSDGHASHEDRQYECLGVGRMAEKELQVMGPE